MSLTGWGGEEAMATIIYVEHDGTRHEQQVTDGWSVMEGAVKNGVRAWL